MFTYALLFILFKDVFVFVIECVCVFSCEYLHMREGALGGLELGCRAVVNYLT